MAITYPVDCGTPLKKLGHSFIIRERLRLLYNLLGKWKNEGITLAEWDAIPSAKVKLLLPYKEKISPEERRKIIDDYWEKLHNKAVQDQCRYLKEVEQDPTPVIDLDKI